MVEVSVEFLRLNFWCPSGKLDVEIIQFLGSVSQTVSVDIHLPRLGSACGLGVTLPALFSLLLLAYRTLQGSFQHVEYRIVPHIDS